MWAWWARGGGAWWAIKEGGVVSVSLATQGLRNDFQDAMEKIDQEYLDDLAKVCCYQCDG